jgi:hypothetical protein
MTVEIGLLVFPNVPKFDLTAPYEIFASWSEARAPGLEDPRGARRRACGS